MTIPLVDLYTMFSLIEAICYRTYTVQMYFEMVGTRMYRLCMTYLLYMKYMVYSRCRYTDPLFYRRPGPRPGGLAHEDYLYPEKFDRTNCSAAIGALFRENARR
jgi:hypothetical protein